jgi:hypothetical protein
MSHIALVHPQFKQPLKALALIISCCPAAHAAATDSEASKTDDKRSWAVLPGAFYSQETSVGAAVLGMYTFSLSGAGDDTWPSSLTATVVYTGRNQASASLWTGLYWGAANDWLMESETFVEHFPTNYYGIGPTSEPSYELFTRRRLATGWTGLRRVAGRFYAGLSHRFSTVEILDIRPPVTANGPVVWTRDDRLASGNVAGGDGTLSHGVGVLTRLDSRDNVQSTHSGHLIDLESALYPAWLGTEHPFTMTTLDLRVFLPVGAGTFASQSITRVGIGEVPFDQLPELGGDNQLRGMFQGRYRDRTSTAIQLELRHPLVWRFGVVGFAGAGQVAPTIAQLARHPPRWTAGGGVRFVIDEQTHTHIRLDVGGGPDGSGFIFTFGEAF